MAIRAAVRSVALACSEPRVFAPFFGHFAPKKFARVFTPNSRVEFWGTSSCREVRPEDFLNSGITIDAQLSSELILNLFASDTPLHDGAVVVKGNRIVAAGVILPLSRQGHSRYGTRHLAALGITERFDRCICVVVSEETGTLSLANHGRLERPITSSRLQNLLTELMGVIPAASVSSASAPVSSGRSVAVANQDTVS